MIMGGSWYWLLVPYLILDCGIETLDIKVSPQAARIRIDRKSLSIIRLRLNM